MQDATRHYINGQWVDSIDGREVTVENPSTEGKVATITLGGVADADAAVTAAKNAFPAWAATDPSERITALERLMEVYKSRARRVARRLRSGMVEMNGKFGGAGSPFGGMKQSGNGREGGAWGLEEFLEVKAVSDWG